MRFATSHQDRLLSLAVCTSPVTFDVHHTDSADVIDREGVAAWMESTITRRLDPNLVSPAYIRWYAAQMAATPAHVVSEFQRRAPGGDLRPLLPHVQTPTLVLAAARLREEVLGDFRGAANLFPTGGWWCFPASPSLSSTSCRSPAPGPGWTLPLACDTDAAPEVCNPPDEPIHGREPPLTCVHQRRSLFMPRSAPTAIDDAVAQLRCRLGQEVTGLPPSKGPIPSPPPLPSSRHGEACASARTACGMPTCDAIRQPGCPMPRASPSRPKRSIGITTTPVFAYDYGRERISWLAHLLTNWMGDDGFLCQPNEQGRRFKMVGLAASPGMAVLPKCSMPTINDHPA